MPCDQVRITEIDIGKLDGDLATAAIKALGLESQVTYSNNTLTVRGNVPNVDTLNARVKQAYGAEVVKATAKKFNWKIKEVPGEQYVYDIIK